MTYDTWTLSDFYQSIYYPISGFSLYKHYREVKVNLLNGKAPYQNLSGFHTDYTGKILNHLTEQYM